MVMKPEPWGEALDALGTAGDRPSSSRRPRGEPFTQALARELATREHLVFACGRYEGIDQRVLDEAARPRRGARDLARRLRAQRGRGGRAGDHRGGRAAAARASWATPSRWPRSPTRTACWSTPSTPSPPSWRGRDVPAGAAVRRPRARSPPGGTSRPYAAPPSAGPTSRTRSSVAARRRRGPPGRAGRRRRALHPAAGLLGAGGAGQPRRRDPGAARVARRRAGVAGRDTVLVAARRPAGWSAPCAAGSTRRRLGHRPADGRPRPAGPRPGPAACSERIEAAAPAEATTYALFTGAGQPAQPADVQEGRATGCAARSTPGVVRSPSDDQVAATIAD